VSRARGDELEGDLRLREDLGGGEPAQPLPAPAGAEPESTARTAPVARTQWQLVRRRFLRHRLAVVSLVVLSLLFVVCVLLPDQIAPYPANPDLGDPDVLLGARESPSFEHWLGTDTAGRDQLSRLIKGGQTSLLIGLSVALAATIIGTAIGAIAGFYGRWIDQVLSRLTDLVLIIPGIGVLAIAGKYLGGGTPAVLILILSVLFWTYVARVVRGLVLSLKEREFVEAARASGASSMRIVLLHILPNMIGPIVVAATLTVTAAILAESTLSYLGFGVEAPSVSWGRMLSNAEGAAGTSLSYLIYAPGLAIVLTLLCVNFVGDGLRDAFDPHSSR
jgi:peptide/nickel transport system permease protein